MAIRFGVSVMLRLGVIVAVTRAVIVIAAETDSQEQPLAEQPGADADHQEARDDLQNRVQALGQDVLGQEQGDQPKGIDSSGMGGGHRATQKKGVLGGPARADQIGSNDRFAVAWLQGVRGAEDCRERRRPSRA